MSAMVAKHHLYETPKQNSFKKKTWYLAIPIGLIFLIYFFSAYHVDSFQIVRKQSIPLTQEDIRKGYTGKYELVIEHRYGSLIGQKAERIIMGEADFSSEELAKTFFSNWTNELKSKSILTEYYKRNGKSFNLSVSINYVESMIVKGHKVEIFQESPLNSSFKVYLFATRNKNKVVEIILKEYDKGKIEKLVEWILKQ